MSLSKPSDENRGFLKSLLKGYVNSMQKRPILTKSCTSAVTGGLACLISQIIITGEFNPRSINWRTVAAYLATGFVFVGPAVHHFHAWLDKTVPKDRSNMALKRLLLDRILFCPSFLFCYLYLLAIFDGQGHQGGIDRVKFAYLPALKMNLQVWTVLQYVNVRYIPQNYRAPFMSFMALLWSVYIATRQRV